MAVSVLPKGISLGPTLDRVQAEAIYARGKEAVIFTILELAKQLAEARNPASATPSTPSGMVPVYEKPAVSRRNKRPGRKNGHPGSGRKRPERIDRREEHRLPCCPHCQGRLKRTQETHTRYVEDIPENLQAEVTEHIDSSRLVPEVQEASHSAGARRLAGRSAGQPRGGAFGVDALRIGYDLAADRGRFQPSPANEGHQGRIGAGLASSARGVFCLVRTDSTRGTLFGRSARRRDGLASKWQNPLAVVFQQPAADILSDRSFAWRAGVAEILRRGVQRHACQRFLGCLQRDCRRPAAKMPGSSVPRPGTCGKIQKSRKTLGGIRQKVAATC